jgi:hypothetical protein
MEISNRLWVKIQMLDPEIWPDGFGNKGSSPSVLWSSITRVAVGYEIHSFAIADWDFWAFQTTDPSVTYWASTNFNDEFSAEVRHRFGIADVPPMKDWVDSEFCIRASAFQTVAGGGSNPARDLFAA